MLAAATAPPCLYRGLIRLLAPALLGYTVWRARKDGGKRYMSQRLGCYKTHSFASDIPRRWIHAASVGEVITVLPLLKALREPLLVTTMSPTGASVLEQQALSHVQHAYLPLDFPGACQRFFRHTPIKSGWIMETEIWPWLYATAHNRQIPLTIINGRLSDKTSSQTNGLLAASYQRALSGVRVLARSEEDRQRFIALGSSSVELAGNLKYAGSVSANRQDSGRQENSIPPLIDRPYVLAASTHEDEELQVARAWHTCFTRQQAKPLLVIVPRHPERGDQIRKQLNKLDIHSSLRSQQQSITSKTEVYIGDTLGEMQAWYAHAVACFVGGSLIERGGHNVLEPAQLGCPIVVGRHTFNFDDIVVPMLQGDALHVANNANEVVEFLKRVYSEPLDYKEMRDYALEQATQCEAIIDTYLQLLSHNNP